MEILNIKDWCRDWVKNFNNDIIKSKKLQSGKQKWVVGYVQEFSIVHLTVPTSKSRGITCSVFSVGCCHAEDERAKGGDSTS